MSLARVEIQAIPASVQIAQVPQPGKPLSFPLESLTRLYGDMSKYGFDSFQVVPSGARMVAGAVREAVVTIEQVSLIEELGASGSDLEPFLELAELLFDGVKTHLGVSGFQIARVKLVAFWPVPNGDAVAFIAKAMNLPSTALVALGPGFTPAGLRFNNGKPGDISEVDIRIEPLLRKRDTLWVEVEPKKKGPFEQGRDITNIAREWRKFMQERLVEAVLAMQGNARRGGKK